MKLKVKLASMFGAMALVAVPEMAVAQTMTYKKDAVTGCTMDATFALGYLQGIDNRYRAVGLGQHVPPAIRSISREFDCGVKAAEACMNVDVYVQHNWIRPDVFMQWPENARLAVTDDRASHCLYTERGRDFAPLFQ